jgi:hypothetical protein
MENFAVRFADFLEDLAKRARAMTVDRLVKVITYVGIGIGVALLGVVAAIFLLVALFRFLGYWIGTTGAYATLGGLFVVVGVFVWRKRNQPTED